jgi:ABC-2 type transport system ATP-binding protein
MTAVWLLAACSGSPDQAANNGGETGGPTTETPPPITGEGRAGVNYNVYLNSNIDGETIAFTVMEPSFVAEGLTTPLILHSHGYSGARITDPTGDAYVEALHAEGFGALSLDERGNGESGGTVRILDPAFEGQDWLQVLDWAEENLTWLRYENSANEVVAKDAPDANPVMGAVGGSYGGGFQHLIYALDEKHRLDAIAPDITWNDLRYSLFPGGVFKAMWATLLAGLGSVPPNTQDQEVQEGLAQGLLTNSLDDEKLALLYSNSLASHCAGENDFTAPGGLRPIDAFYSQSAQDTLFNYNDAQRNFDCVSSLGGDVRMYVKSGGHGLDNGDGSQVCGGLGRVEATTAWYREKLLHQVGEADIIPDVCLQLGPTQGDSVTPDSVSTGGTDVAIPESPVTYGPASLNTLADMVALVTSFAPENPLEPLTNLPAGLVSGLSGLSGGNLGRQEIVVYDGAVDGANVLAGIPTFEITTELPAGACAALVVSTPLDPIIFVGLGVRDGADGTIRTLHNQMTPFRGCIDNQLTELVGVFERIEANEQLLLLMQGDFTPQYLGNASASVGSINVSGTLSLPLLGDLPSVEAP